MAVAPASASNRACSPRAPRRWAALLLLAAAAAASAQTTLRGQVSDRTTAQPLVGVAVELRRGAQLMQGATTDADGRFLINVDTGGGAQAQNFKLGARREQYVEAARDVVIASGTALNPIIDFALVRQSVADCLPRLARPRRVVVAHFLPPSQAPAGAAFAERVAHAVRHQLLFLERSGLAAPLQHSVVACTQLDDADNLGALAREMKADALMGGQIAQAPGGARYNVTMTLRDAYGLFDSLAPIRNPGVDLDDASASRLAPEALAGVVQALVTGHVKAGRFAECVQLANLALEALPRPASAALLALRNDCQRQQPALGLTRGAP